MDFVHAAAAQEVEPWEEIAVQILWLYMDREKEKCFWESQFNFLSTLSVCVCVCVGGRRGGGGGILLASI